MSQVDVFSFGVIMYELLVRQVTSAVVSQAGDMTLPEMYAQKVVSFSRPAVIQHLYRKKMCQTLMPCVCRRLFIKKVLQHVLLWSIKCKMHVSMEWSLIGRLGTDNYGCACLVHIYSLL